MRRACGAGKGAFGQVIGMQACHAKGSEMDKIWVSILKNIKHCKRFLRLGENKIESKRARGNRGVGMEGSRKVLENLALLACGDLEALEQAAELAARRALMSALEGCAAGDIRRRACSDFPEPEWTYGLNENSASLCVTIDVEFALAAPPAGAGEALREQAVRSGAQKALAQAGLDEYDSSAWARSLSGSGKRFTIGMSVEFDWKTMAAGALAKREADALGRSALAGQGKGRAKL